MTARAWPWPEFLQARLAAGPPAPLERALVAYSGGLDSLLCVALARAVYGCERVHAVLGDIGQGEEVIGRAQQRLAAAGFEPAEVLDLHADFQRDWLPRAIRANAQLRGYPIAAPMIKQILGRRLGELAGRRGDQAVIEGSSGVGNDQFRFAISLARFAPHVRHVSPLRDLDLSRREEIELCEHWGLDYDRALALGGDDVTPWCRSIASGALRRDEPLDPRLFLWLRPPEETPAAPERFELGFESGQPVSLDGARADLQELLEVLNPRLGRHGVGLVDVIEDNRLHFKGREVYEAPAATAILRAKSELESICLTREELAAKTDWEQRWVELVYRGEAFHPLVAALDAALAIVQQRVSGSVLLEARGGLLRTVRRVSPFSLLEGLPRLEAGPARLSAACRGIIEWERLKYAALRGAGDA